MCGIVGYIGSKQAAPILIDGLRRLEYRGYDSAGVAIMDGKRFSVIKEAGKVDEVAKIVEKISPKGCVGVGHTRWATHGAPNQVNAHPHVDWTGNFVIVHNGIIENYQEIKKDLLAKGIKFTSDTDTEVIVQLISYLYEGDFVKAVMRALSRLDGSFAIAVLSVNHPDMIILARQGSPLVIGIGEGEHFCASDVPAILPYTRKVIYLDEGEIAVLKKDSFVVMDLEGNIKEKKIHTVEWNVSMAEKGGYEHYMLKEIHEQGAVVRATLEGRVKDNKVELEIDWSSDFAKSISEIHIVACGTSYYASLVAERALEAWTDLPIKVDIASEYRYRRLKIKPSTLVVLVSQSGETADTLAAERKAKSFGAITLGVTNVIGSTLAREVDHVLLLKAGPEIGVAATKTFSGQIAVLYLFALYLGKLRGNISDTMEKAVVDELIKMPYKIELTLEKEPYIKEIAEKYYRYNNFLYLGRGVSFPIAMEGALKLKEISYIHAEAYAAGEMKHGPIALIDENMPVMVVVPKDSLYEKSISNIQETKARNARVIAVATEGDEGIFSHAEDVMYVPETIEELTPHLTVIPLQLFAYHVASLRGCEIDKPRNLAKSVTVE